MKKTIIALLALAGGAFAELTEVATMSDLLSGTNINFGTGVVKVSSDSATGYSFTGEGAITGITSTTLSEAITDGTGFLTIAAWIKPSDLSGAESIFSWGGQNTGFKFGISGTAPQLTTKEVADNTPGATTMQMSKADWYMLAVTIDLAGDGSGDRDTYFFIGADGYTSLTRSGNWNTLYPGNDVGTDEDVFGIGSGNGNGNRDLFEGTIANLTVFTSDSVATAAELKTAMGNTAPILIPEPATATLSLLALCGLAARRRRS